MQIKKNWFHILTLVIFELFAVYAVISTIISLTDSKSCRLICYVGTICILALAMAFVHILSWFSARLILLQHGQI